MAVEASIQRQSLWSRPRGIGLIIFALVALWWLMRDNPTALVILAIVILFIVGIKKPLWAIAALLLSQLTITSFMVVTPFAAISLRLLLLVLTLLIIWRAVVQRQINLGPNARRVIIPIIILIVVSGIANWINSSVDFAFKDFRNLMVGLLTVILVPMVIRTSKNLKVLCAVTFFVVVASAVVGLMQHYNILGMEQATIRPDFLLTREDNRVPGMAETQLELSYILTVAILVSLGVFVTRGITSSNRILLLISMLLMAIVLYFTFTRSSLFALGLGLIAFPLFLKTRIRWDIVLIVFLVAVIFIDMTGMLSGQYLGGRSLEVQEESSISRKILWQAGIAIALDNPLLGIGGDQYTEVAPQYADRVDPSLIAWEKRQYWGYTTLGNEQVHNDFLYIWLSYGTVALLAYLWLYIAILRNLLDAHRKSKRRFIKGLALGLAAALVAYGVNAFYHNLMITMPILWIIAGFSMATLKLAQRNSGGQVHKPAAKTSNS